jgi:serine protease Do
VTIWRDGKEKTLSIKLGERPDNVASVKESEPVKNALGIEVDNLTRENMRKLNVDYDEDGVLVVGVSETSPAGRQGVRAGDLIKEVNRKKITNTKEFDAVIKEVKPGEVVLFRLRRGDNSLFAAIRMPKDQN